LIFILFAVFCWFSVHAELFVFITSVGFNKNSPIEQFGSIQTRQLTNRKSASAINAGNGSFLGIEILFEGQLI